ncbi:hypothetical protein V2G26_006024 [Clonostachys chloroleuca]
MDRATAEHDYLRSCGQVPTYVIDKQTAPAPAIAMSLAANPYPVRRPGSHHNLHYSASPAQPSTTLTPKPIREDTQSSPPSHLPLYEPYNKYNVLRRSSSLKYLHPS